MGTKLAVLAVALLSACSDGAGTDAASPVSGMWHYSGTQVTPASAQLDGSLSWRGVASPAGGFEGTFLIVEVGASGQQQTLSGASAGQIVADTLADFDMDVSGADRHHLGVLRGDSISGMWTEIGGSGAGGRFVLRRNTAGIR